MFTDINSGHQALCLCWRGDPPVLDDDKFDTPMLSCANYLQTANPAFYSNISVLEGFCTNWNGDVQSLLPATSYELTTIFLNSTTVNSTPSTTANSISTSTPTTTAKASTTNPSIGNNTPTTTAKPNTGSSLRGEIFTKLFFRFGGWVLCMLLRF